MALQVVNTAELQCSFGLAPSTLVVLPVHEVFVDDEPAATIMDSVPMENIMPFGMCTSLANPEVASATAAAMGVLTPMPCIPITPDPWDPGSPTVLIGSIPALNNTSTCTCTWAGVITITDPGQEDTQIP